jgi:hypothetical protein
MPGLLARGLGLGGLVTRGLGYVPAVPADPFVVDLIAYLQGAAPSLTFWPGQVPEAWTTYPAVAYLLVDGDDDALLSGPSGLILDTYQFDLYARDPVDLHRGLAAIRRALATCVGQVGSHRVRSCSAHNRLSTYEEAVDGSDQGWHRLMLECRIAHDRS